LAQFDPQLEEAVLSLFASEQQPALSPLMHCPSLAQHDFSFLSPQQDIICLPSLLCAVFRAQLWPSFAEPIFSQQAHFAFSVGAVVVAGFELAVWAQVATARASIKAIVLYLIA
jgi:hypothetical protein